MGQTPNLLERMIGPTFQLSQAVIGKQLWTATILR
jgi:hypothetical protein